MSVQTYDGGPKKSVSPLVLSDDEFELPDSEELINQNTAKTLTFKQSRELNTYKLDLLAFTRSCNFDGAISLNPRRSLTSCI